MRSRFIVVLVLAFLSVPAFAQSSDIAVWYSGSKVGTTNSGTSSIEFKNGKGYGVSYNRYFGDHFSAEFSFIDLHYDGEIRDQGEALLDTGRLKTKTITGIAQWHFSRRALIDPYLGAGVAYVKADDLSSNDLTGAGIGSVAIDKKWGLAANAGLNVNLLHNLALAIDGKYIPYEPKSGTTGMKLKLNPTVYSAGVRFRF